MTESSNHFSVRRYTDADYFAVRDNLEAAGMYDPTSQSRENLRFMSEDSRYAVLVAATDDEVVGNVIATPYGKSVSIIWGFVVAERCRRQGVGAKLMKAVEAEFGIGEIWGFIKSREYDAKAFYENQGYRLDKTTDFTAFWKEI